MTALFMSFENETWQLCLVLHFSCHHIYFSSLLNSHLHMLAVSVHWKFLSEFCSNVELLTFIHINNGYKWSKNSINCFWFKCPFPPLLSGAYLAVRLLWACLCLVAKNINIYMIYIYIYKNKNIQIYDGLQDTGAATGSGQYITSFWGHNISNVVTQPGRWYISFQRNQQLQHLISLMENHCT